MKTFLKIKFLGFFLLLILVSSCNTKETVQTYMLSKVEDPDFIALTIPSSVLNIAVDSLSKDEKEAVSSLKKLNILVFNAKEDTQKMNLENAKIQSAISNSSYLELVKMNSNLGKGGFYFQGKEDAIDEFLVYGSDGKSHIVLLRILGSDMNTSHLKPFVNALKHSDFQKEELSGLLEALQPIYQ